ncbi:MAG: xanthine dehydrogenase family protein molybdopterin-binding subunit [Planctomycetota bacterium]|jgi:xanthine dehydrogenase molybdenum-binding subunit
MTSKIEKETLIGKRIPKLDAPRKVTGEAQYLHDLELPGMLAAKILRSDRVHARIVSIDTSAAKALPGVKAVLTAADTPGVPLGHGKDNPPLKGDKVRCIRDEIAAVAAESEAVAARALELIKVAYEDLPTVFSPADALAEGAPVIHEAHPNNIPFTWDYRQGDIARGEAESDIVIEDTFRLHFVAHCCMGVSGALAQFDSEGNLTVYSQTQVPFLYKKEISPVIDVPPERIRVIQPIIGGAFGSKLDIYPFEPICILLAKATGRPVRLLFSRHEEFVASPTRQPVEMTLRSGVKKDGTLTFRECRTLHDNGGYTSWGATTPFVIMQTISSLYRVPHCRYHTTVVYTNNPYSGSFRGFGNLQATFAVESHMDKLAEAVGMDPVGFRLHNAQRPGETTPQGMVFRSCGLEECLDTAARESGFLVKAAANKLAWRRRRDAPGGVRHGIGMASLLHVGGGAKIYRSDGCGTILKIDDHGHVTVITGSTDIGQGSETVIAQLVAEELGLGVSTVTVINNDSEITPWDVGVHASRTTFIAGNSARRAARKARSKLLQAAGTQLEIDPDQLDLRQGHVVRARDGEALMDLGKLIRSLHFSVKSDVVMTTEYYEPPSVMQDKEFKGDVSASYAFGTQVVELEVDTATGIIRILKVTAAHDVGRVVNALGAEGQVEGGVVMGMGYAISEHLQIDEGIVTNPCFRDYKLITAPEIPQIYAHFIETQDPEGPVGAKGIGEAPAICTAAAIANALYNATGVRMYELPLTPERVLRALEDDREGKW